MAPLSSFRHHHVAIDEISIHVVEGGRSSESTVLFLHGWPESWQAFEQIMRSLAADTRVVALDLPGIGASEIPARAHDKRTLARYVRGVVRTLELRDVTLVGHDVGGQIVYAYLRAYPNELQRAVIMNVAIPGVEPWSEITRNPAIWHFAFHTIPDLPERLVAGRQAVYFGYFYDHISARPEGVAEHSRLSYVYAYTRPTALRTGFEWYRAFAKDEKDNLSLRDTPVGTPVLYLRGDTDPGLSLDRYVVGLRESGLQDVRGAVIPNSGHFAPDEQPHAVLTALRDFIGLEHAVGDR